MTTKQDLEKILKDTGNNIRILDERILNNSEIDIPSSPKDRETIIFYINDSYMETFAFYRILTHTNTIMIGAAITENDNLRDKQRFLEVQNSLNKQEDLIYSEINKKLNQRGLRSETSFEGILLENASISGSGTFQLYATKEYTIQENMNKFLRNELKKSIIIGVTIYDTLRKFYDPQRIEFHDKIKFDYEYQTQNIRPDIEATNAHELDLSKIKSADKIFSDYNLQLSSILRLFPFGSKIPM